MKRKSSVEAVTERDAARHREIKDALRANGASLSTIARELGVNVVSVSLVSRGLVSSEKISRGIANRLGKTPQELWPWRKGFTMADRIPTGESDSQNSYKGGSLMPRPVMPRPKKEPIGAEDLSAHSGKLAVVGQRIRVAREHGGLDQQEFAKIAGFSRRQVSAWERGANAPPIWVLEKLREHCDVDPEWVISGPGETPLRDVLPELRTRDGILRLEAEKLVRAAKITSEETVIAVLALLRLAPPGSERMAKIHIQNLLAKMAAPSERSQIVPT